MAFPRLVRTNGFMTQLQDQKVPSGSAGGRVLSGREIRDCAEDETAHEIRQPDTKKVHFKNCKYYEHKLETNHKKICTVSRRLDRSGVHTLKILKWRKG